MSKVYPSNNPDPERDEADDKKELTYREPFVHRLLLIVGTVTAVVLLLVFLWVATRILLIVFTGILLAVLLRALSNILSKYISIPPAWSLAVVVLALIGLLGLGGWLLAPQVIEQVDKLTQALSDAIQQARQTLEAYTWGRFLIHQTPDASDLLGGDVLAAAPGIFSSTLGMLVEVVVVLFIGLYLAATPELYVHGILRLIPISKRDRAQEVLDRLGYTLRWWLLGQLFAMLVVGILAALGLWLLDVPLALAFGLLTFLLTFVPYIGPIVSALLPALVALMESPMLALYVLLLYLVIQNLEGYVLTPLIHRGTVLVPPALTITTQVLFGVLFGILGVMLATPFIAVVLVLVKMLYIEDVLGDPIIEMEQQSKKGGEHRAHALPTAREADRRATKEGKRDARA